MLSRMEHDSIGALNVPAEAYYGVQSMRAATNFQINTPSITSSIDRQHRNGQKQQRSQMKSLEN